MLPARNRLVRPGDFRAATKGPRAAGEFIVIHVTTTDAGADQAARVGFVVSKSVGNAVRRNRTKRRLRALMSTHVSELPAGCGVVVRARPSAATATFAQLSDEMDRLLPRALRPRRPRLTAVATASGSRP